MSLPEGKESLKPAEVIAAAQMVAPPRSPKILDFLAGLPAIIAVFGLLGLLGLALLNPPTAANYAAESKRRLEKDDAPGAMVCARRVATMRPGDAENRYQMITLLLKTGDIQRADAIAQEMVDLDDRQYDQAAKEEGGFGLAQAHLYLAERYASDVRNIPRTWPKIEQHLKKYMRVARATGRTKEALQAEGMLGEVYAQADILKEAREILEKTSADNPMRLFKLGVVCDKLRDHDIAVRHFKAAVQSAKAAIGENPENRPARVAWALSTASLRDFAGALKILNDGYELSREEEYRRMMASICLDWARILRLEPGPNGDTHLAERIKHVEDGLKLDPTNLELLTELGAMMDLPAKEAEEAKKIFNRLIASSQSAGTCHFFLGNDAWKRDKIDVARTHWEEAFKLEPKMPIVANNLAFLLAFKEPVDEKRAISIVDQALNVQGSTPALQGQLLGTRGQILAKMGKWKEALTSLEASLRSEQKSPGIHAALAETYEHLDMKDLAEEHKRIAEELAKAKVR